MHISLFAYDNKNENAPDLYNSLQTIQEELLLKPNFFSYLYLLPPEKADHPGDFKSKVINKKSLESGLHSGEIKSFGLSNEKDLRDPSVYAIYVNNKIHGGTSNISMHLPIEYYSDKLKKLMDDLIVKASPGYAFQTETESALKGVAYLLASTIYKNEKSNFSSFLLKNEKIAMPRMIYSVNYFTEDQLNFVSNNIRLEEFIESIFGDKSLVWITPSISKLEVDSKNIREVNDIFGKAGYLISWLEPRAKT